MDNEPELWDTTHTDMHPLEVDYDEVLLRFLDYAMAIRAVDPTAQVTGPVASGWLGYFFSARDRDTDRCASHADRATWAASSDPDTVSCYAAMDSRSDRPTLMLINKSMDHAEHADLRLEECRSARLATCYQLAGKHKNSTQTLADVDINGGRFHDPPAPASITLLVLRRH